MSSIRLQYLAHLRNNSLVNQQLREEWAQRTLLYTPRNRIVYHNVQPHLEATYSRSALVFDSQFAGGNLDFAVKVKSREYDLYIRPDTNTTGNFQWFYFRVSNTLQDQSIRFNVRNICRHNPLYEQGFAPYSNSRQEGSIWKMLHPIANRVLTTMEATEGNGVYPLTTHFGATSMRLNLPANHLTLTRMLPNCWHFPRELDSSAHPCWA